MEEADKALYDFVDEFCYFISINPNKYKVKDSSMEETFIVSEKYIIFREADDESVSCLIYNTEKNRIVNDNEIKIKLGYNPEKTLEESIYNFLNCSKSFKNYSVEKPKFKKALEFILG